MRIEQYHVVTVSYELRLGNHTGELVETLTKEKPLKFIIGIGSMLPDFEVNLIAKEVGDTFDFVVHKERGFGEFKPESVVTVPKSIFVLDGRLAEELMVVGTTIPVNLKGNAMKGRILEVKENAVKIDFNHPMASRHLHFKGEILEIRNATSEEMATKQVQE